MDASDNDTRRKDRKQLTRDAYAAFAAGDRDAIEALLADDFAFASPADPYLDRQGFFERCWPGAGTIGDHEFPRLVENGDEVIVTYEATKDDGTRIRNTEIHTFRGDQVVRQEVYWGWNLD